MSDTTNNKALLVILAIFIPPLAVYLKTKDVTKTVINLVLCFLFYIPGLIHALYVVLKG
jgi:uncharacterized membrane protein YqaE (UPF0057 family)